MKDYNKALQSFSQALLSPDLQLQSRSHYNLGNTLYQHGDAQKKTDEKLKDWTNALQHYEQTLKIEPENKEAKENYEYVKNKIEELKKQQEQPSPTPTPSPSPRRQEGSEEPGPAVQGQGKEGSAGSIRQRRRQEAARESGSIAGAKRSEQRKGRSAKTRSIADALPFPWRTTAAARRITVAFAGREPGQARRESQSVSRRTGPGLAVSGREWVEPFALTWRGKRSALPFSR